MILYIFLHKKVGGSQLDRENIARNIKGNKTERVSYFNQQRNLFSLLLHTFYLKTNNIWLIGFVYVIESTHLL